MSKFAALPTLFFALLGVSPEQWVASAARGAARLRQMYSRLAAELDISTEEAAKLDRLHLEGDLILADRRVRALSR